MLAIKLVLFTDYSDRFARVEPIFAGETLMCMRSVWPDGEAIEPLVGNWPDGEA